MLFEMYKRWADKRGFSLEVTEWQDGQEAGRRQRRVHDQGSLRLRSAPGRARCSPTRSHLAVRFPGPPAHRLRLASAWWPDIEDAADQVQIDDKDLRVDVFRSSGAGGQHVNTTDSAVRITHLPTGIVVSCQNERSQHQNKDRCMQMLSMKLVDLERQKREDELAAEAGESKSVEWGSQIRCYVLQPYQQVKDERSGLVSGNPEGVSNGDVTPFMEAWLRWRRARRPHWRSEAHDQARRASRRTIRARPWPCVSASADIAKGEFVFLVGPSGSGKSTFLRLINKQEDPDRRADLRRRQGHRSSCRQLEGPDAAPQHRLCLPGLQAPAQQARSPRT